MDVAMEALQHRRQGSRHRAKMAGQRKSLRHHQSFGIEEGRRIIEIVPQDVRIGCAVNRQRHFVGDGQYRVFEELELEGIGERFCHAESFFPASITIAKLVNRSWSYVAK